METLEPRRGRRRRLTLTIARRRRERYARLWWDLSPEKFASRPRGSLFFFTRHYWHDPCSKKGSGSPKFGTGCKRGYRWTALMRLWSKRLARDVAAGRVDPDWVEPPRGFYGMVEQKRLREARIAEDDEGTGV